MNHPQAWEFLIMIISLLTAINSWRIRALEKRKP